MIKFILLLIIPLTIVTTTEFTWNDNYVPTYDYIRGNSLHTVQDGDTLESISLKYYNTTALWPRVFTSNSQYFINQDMPGKLEKLPPGITFQIEALPPAPAQNLSQEDAGGARMLLPHDEIERYELDALHFDLTEDGNRFWDNLYQLSRYFDPRTRRLSFVFENISPYVLRHWKVRCETYHDQEDGWNSNNIPELPRTLFTGQFWEFRFTVTTVTFLPPPFCVIEAEISGLARKIEFAFRAEVASVTNYLVLSSYTDPSKSAWKQIENYFHNHDGAQEILHHWKGIPHIGYKSPSTNWIFHEVPGDLHGSTLAAFMPQSKVGTAKILFYRDYDPFYDSSTFWYLYTAADKAKVISCTTAQCSSITASATNKALARTYLRPESAFNGYFTISQGDKYLTTSTSGFDLVLSSSLNTTLPNQNQGFLMTPCNDGSYQITQGDKVLVPVGTIWKFIHSDKICDAGKVFISDI